MNPALDNDFWKEPDPEEAFYHRKHMMKSFRKPVELDKEPGKPVKVRVKR